MQCMLIMSCMTQLRRNRQVVRWCIILWCQCWEVLDTQESRWQAHSQGLILCDFLSKECGRVHKKTIAQGLTFIYKRMQWSLHYSCAYRAGCLRGHRSWQSVRTCPAPAAVQCPCSPSRWWWKVSWLVIGTSADQIQHWGWPRDRRAVRPAFRIARWNTPVQGMTQKWKKSKSIRKTVSMHLLQKSDLVWSWYFKTCPKQQSSGA